MKLRTMIKKILVHLPIIDGFVYRVLYRQVKSEKAIRAKIQEAAHQIDKQVSQNAKAPYNNVKELEFFMNKLRRKNVSIDEALFWALAIYAIGRHRLQSEYVQSLENTQSSVEPSGGKADLVATIKERRSIRKWTHDGINYQDMKDVIEVARWAPSSCNRQTWQALLIDRQQDKEFLLNYFSDKFWLSAPILIVVMINIEPYFEVEKHFAYLDAGAFIQNLLLALHARGYGTCWIGFGKWDTLNNVHIDMNRYKAFYEYFKLSNQKIPVSMVAVGKPAIKPRGPSRQSLDNIIIDGFLTHQ